MTGSKPKVLVIDDEPDIIEIFSEALEDEFEVHGCSQGRDGLSRAKTLLPQIVLLDIGLPDVSGYEICEQLKQDVKTADCAVIFVSGSNTLEERLKGYEVGGDEYITKPFQLKEVIVKLRSVSSFQQDKQKLSQQAQQATQTALQAMTDTSEYGELLQFVKRSFHIHQLDQLADAIIKSTDRFGVNCSVQLRSTQSTITRSRKGRASPLEEELITTLSKQGRIFDFKQRTIFNYSHASLLCKNMPLDDPLKYGRLKDLLIVLVEAAEARILDLQKSTALKTVLNATQEGIMLVEEKFTSHERSTSQIMERLMTSMQDGFSRLALTEEQEEFFMKLLEDSMQQLVTLYSGEVEISRQFTEIAKQLSQAVDESQGD